MTLPLSVRALPCVVSLAVTTLASVAFAAQTPSNTATAIATDQWPCSPAPAPIPEGFDPEQIYLPSRPAPLPDGKQFIFEWCDAIWIAPTEGGIAKVIQHSTGRDAWPIVSRDGTRFAFQSNRAGGWHTFVADIEEGAVARQIGFNSEAERPYVWSADDSELLCYVVRDDEGSVFDLGRLAWLPVDKRAAERRVFDAMASDPALSPDGRYILFTQEGEDLYRKGSTGENVSRIWCYDTETGAFMRIVKHDTESLSPMWAPDGKGFYYVSGQGGTRNIWYHAFPGSEERQLTFFKGDSVIHPSLAANGEMMIFRQGLWFWSFNPTTPDIPPKKITLRPENTGLANGPTIRRTYRAIWNCDSNGTLAATSNGLELAFTTGGDLYVMDTIMREPHLVYGNSRTHERNCVFSADGQTLYFFSDRGDNVALLKATKFRPDIFWWENPDFTITSVIEDDLRRDGLSISPDGTRMAWIETESVLTIADAFGRVIRRFPKAKAVGNYDWSPDGKWIVAAISDDYSNNDICIYSVDNPDQKPYNLSRSFNWEGTPTWSPDGQLIAWNGVRVGGDHALFYVWLNPLNEDDLKTQDYRRALEHMGISSANREGAPMFGATALAAPDPHSPNADIAHAQKKDKPSVVINFEKLHDRVRNVAVPNIGAPTFAPDSRRILFPATINGQAGTYQITLPQTLTPTLTAKRWGYPIGWFGRDPDKTKADRLLMVTADRKIGTLTETYDFCVYQNLNLRDYQELGFLSAWGVLRDVYYDPNFHGADWNAIRAKYQAPARYAARRSIFDRIMQSLMGELNSSHLGFYHSESTRKIWDTPPTPHDWEPVTSHLGILYDPNYTGEHGWMVKRIIPGGPADSNQINLKPGDIITAINGVAVRNGMDPTLLLNAPKPGKYIVDVRTGATTRKVFIEAVTYRDARRLIQNAMYKGRRDYVHLRSGGTLGYINIAQMNDDEYNRFEHEIFAEGFDKDGMVIDVRDNTGGFTADKILNILGVQRHSWSVARHGNPAYLAGYWGRPVFDKPIVVLCNQNTVSNGEIFSHAIKQLKRGKLVGIQTNGGVIATMDTPLLDLGMIRRAHYGWYTLDGTDMELCGALPDVIVENTPADTDAGRDPQLDAAIDILIDDVKAYQRNTRPFVPKTYKWDHHL